MTTATSAAMAGGLVVGYGSFAAMAGRYLYPARPRETGWMFVVEVGRMKLGDSVTFQIPAGERVVVTRQGSAGTVQDFIALSSTCPHLGCQVHWESQNQRFFCPCHNGTFNPSGKATGGPPGEAGQSLPVYPLRIENSLLFIEVPLESLASGGGERPE